TGTAPTQAARAPLPITGDNLVIIAAAASEAGNNIVVTITPGRADEDLYSGVVERRHPDGTYAVLGTVTAVTNASVRAAIAGQAGMCVIVPNAPSTPPAPPFAVARAHLSGGDADTPANVQLPTG